MEAVYREEEIFEKLVFSEAPLPKGEYENCRFIACDFSGASLNDFKFSACEFIGCNLSLAKLHKTALQDVLFRDCKMLGLRLEECSEFGLSFRFESCSLNHCSFYRLKLKKTCFTDCQLREADFTEADLSSALFGNCDLLHASFDNTLLEKADFRTAYNYTIDPESNRIKKARFSLAGLPGLLDKYGIEVE